MRTNRIFTPARFENPIQPWLINSLVAYQERIRAKYPSHVKHLINDWSPNSQRFQRLQLKKRLYLCLISSLLEGPFGRVRCSVCRGWTKVGRAWAIRTEADQTASTIADVLLHLKRVRHRQAQTLISTD